MRARSWVLSPISAIATTPAETKRGSMKPSGGTGRIPFDFLAPPDPAGEAQASQRSRQALCRTRHGQGQEPEAKSVDAFPSYRGRLLPRDGSSLGQDAVSAKRFAGLFVAAASSKMPHFAKASQPGRP